MDYRPIDRPLSLVAEQFGGAETGDGTRRPERERVQQNQCGWCHQYESDHRDRSNVLQGNTFRDDAPADPPRHDAQWDADGQTDGGDDRGLRVDD